LLLCRLVKQRCRLQGPWPMMNVDAWPRLPVVSALEWIALEEPTGKMLELHLLLHDVYPGARSPQTAATKVLFGLLKRYRGCLTEFEASGRRFERPLGNG